MVELGDLEVYPAAEKSFPCFLQLMTLNLQTQLHIYVSTHYNLHAVIQTKNLHRTNLQYATYIDVQCLHTRLDEMNRPVRGIYIPCSEIAVLMITINYSFYFTFIH